MNVIDEAMKYFKESPAPSRHARQMAIESAISQFQPDFVEADEILAALQASLERRYEQDISDVLNEMKQLREALLEADATEEREHDEMNNRLRIASERGE